MKTSPHFPLVSPGSVLSTHSVMRQLVSRLSRSSAVRTTARFFRLNRLGNAWLRTFPSIRTLPGSGIRYRATRLESIPLADEMFDKNVLYDPTLLPAGFTTYIDLGCNVGYFSCWLMHLAQGRKLKGLMVDANPTAVVEARWHAETNGMPEIYSLNGIVGEGPEGNAAEFFVYESNICSMSKMPDTAAAGLNGKWEKISVPCLSIESQWRKHFGDLRCNVLKIDIEGSELRFLKAERTFLALCDSVIVEWHKWEVGLPELEAVLTEVGFRHLKTIDENDSMGTAVYRR